VEIAHEALVTAWPYFQNLLQQAADDKRILDTLIPRAQAWAAEKDQRARRNRLATGADLELFAALRDRRKAWLSGDEHGLVEASVSAEQTRQQRQRWQFRVAIAASVVFLVLFVGAVWFYLEAQEQTRVAGEQTRVAERQEQIALSRMLAAQSTEYASHRPNLSILLALASNNTSKTSEAGTALFAALARDNYLTHTLTNPAGSDKFETLDRPLGFGSRRYEAMTVKFSPDDKLLAEGSGDGRVFLWDLTSLKKPAEKKRPR
jgi:hypothetical protein